MIPASPVIIAPSRTPDIVNSLIYEAASVALFSLGAAANRVRVAIDELLASCGILRYRANKSRKKIRV